MSGSFVEDGEDNKPKGFEHAFWGKDDRGVEAVMTKLRKAKLTCTELKNLLAARSSLEEDYGKKMIKLAKSEFGKDETGNLQKALSRVRSELEQTGHSHVELGIKLKADLETRLHTFINDQRLKRKAQAAIIEKSSKSKSLKHANLIKIKEKYIAEKTKANTLDAINSQAQKDIEKAQLRQQRIKGLESEYGTLSAELEEATKIWQHDWRVSCRLFQELEEQRVEFLKSVTADYTNLIAEVCVKDDESCERIRLALEKIRVNDEIQTFISERATGFDPDYEPDGSPIYDIPTLDTPLDAHSPSTSTPNPFHNKPGQLFKKAFHRPLSFASGTSIFGSGKEKKEKEKNGKGLYHSNSGSSSNIASSSNIKSQSEKDDQSDHMISPEIKTNDKHQLPQITPSAPPHHLQSQSLSSFYDDVIDEARARETVISPTNDLKSPPPVINEEVDEYHPSPVQPQEQYLSPAQELPPARPLFFVRAMHDYPKQAYHELSFMQGQVLAVLLCHDDGWWEGEVIDPVTGSATRGLFPSNYCVRVD